MEWLRFIDFTNIGDFGWRIGLKALTLSGGFTISSIDLHLIRGSSGIFDGVFAAGSKGWLITEIEVFLVG